MPGRPLWSDAGDDPEAIASLLESAAASKELVFEPAPRKGSAAALHQAALIVARRRLTERHGEKDRILIQEIAAMDEVVRSSNLLVERLREWYALHAPEVVRREPDAQRLASLVAEHGDRALVLASLDRADEAARSLGTDLGTADLAVLQGFAQALDGLHGSWQALEERVSDLMEEVAPNLAAVVGPMIGARLIQQAGSLQRLACWPAGTVQTLGAETALFRHIKEGSKPPKHGILFQHPQVFQAPPWQRGPVARVLASHAVTAARADTFTGNDLRELLAASLAAGLATVAKKKAPVRRHGRAPARKPYGKPAGGPREKPRTPYGKPQGKPYGKPQGKPYAKSGPKPGGSKPPGKPRKKGRFDNTGPARPPGGRK